MNLSPLEMSLIFLLIVVTVICVAFSQMIEAKSKMIHSMSESIADYMWENQQLLERIEMLELDNEVLTHKAKQTTSCKAESI